MSKKYRIGWFSTGRGEGSQALLRAAHDAIESGELDAEIEFVFCSRDRGETEPTDRYLDMANSYGIPLVTFSYQKYRAKRGMPDPDLSQPLPQWRTDYDREVIKRLKKFKPDIVLLAGLQIIASPLMCETYDIINLHPAAPGGPAGTWRQVIWRLIETGADRHGVKIHVAIPQLDMGPTATYCTFPIRGPAFDGYREEIKGRTLEQVKAEQGEENMLFKTIRAHGAARELPLIIATLRLFSQGKLHITEDQQVTDEDWHVIPGYDLAIEIDEKVKGKV